MASEGMASRYGRHKEMGDLVRKWSSKLFGMFPEKEYMSNTIGVLNRGTLDFENFHKSLKSKGYEISGGYGDVKETTFRIGHMGDLTPERIKGLLSVMDETLEECQ